MEGERLHLSSFAIASGWLFWGFATGRDVSGLVSPPSLAMLHTCTNEWELICLLTVWEVPHHPHMYGIPKAAQLLCSAGKMRAPKWKHLWGWGILL